MLAERTANNLHKITLREREILKLIAEGYEDEDIANNLRMGIKTVRKYQLKLMRKWNLPDMSLVMGYALEKGIVSIDF